MEKKKLLPAYSKKSPVKGLKHALETADAILVGAGAGLSAAAGFAYDGERFQKHFHDFAEKYGITDMYSGGFYPYPTLEEYWAWWSRHILINRYDVPVGRPYADLLRVLQGKNYFVLTTNVDHQFQLAGFGKERLFYTQGDYGLFQCSGPCCQETFGNEAQVRRMAEAQWGMRVPPELVPKCPRCGRPMAMNLRADSSFVEDGGWRRAAGRYGEFLRKWKDKGILLLELGVGYNTPGIIKYPFWQMAAQNPEAAYVCVNYGEAACPQEIEGQSICIGGDIGEVLELL